MNVNMRVKKTIIYAVLATMAVFLINANIVNVKAAESDEEIKAELYVDKSSYKAGEKVNACFSVTNYNDSFTGNITTMIIELGFDDKVLTANKSSFKKLADDNGGMGFSHISLDYNNIITYQYVNVSEPLKKGSSEIFAVSFETDSDIDSIEDVLNVSEIIVQDGTMEESVRFPVTASMYVDKKAQDIANDNKRGQQVYDSQGELIDSEKNSQNNNNKTKENNEIADDKEHNNIKSENQADSKKISDNENITKEENDGIEGNIQNISDDVMQTSENVSESNQEKSNYDGIKNNNSKDNDSKDVKIQNENNTTNGNNIGLVIAVVLIVLVGLAGYIIIKKKSNQ